MDRTVYVVHCIDTEGPLHESVEATFGRLKEIFHLDLEPSVDLLRRLQAGAVDLGGLETAVQKVVDPHLLDYKATWDQVDAMLETLLSPNFRTRTCDTDGQGWVYNWFCVDHVDYAVNPRRRDLGYHNIFDHYRSMIRETGSGQDGLHFHYHPHAFRSEAHRNATHWWASSGTLHQVLSRRVIDRHWFPAAHRPGFHVIRPDSHWFLEQFIPFDFSNQAMAPTPDDAAQDGLAGGRFGDWRRAPATWQPYHPAHDDYQAPGDCRRWIARCLNVGTRFRLVTERDVRQAFEEARDGRPVVLGITNHDFRDMGPDVEQVRAMLTRVAPDYPGVSFRFSEAVQAMRDALDLPAQPPCELEMTLTAGGEGAHVLEVHSPTPTFGPQPWLALKTVTGTYHHDNFDMWDSRHQPWNSARMGPGKDLVAGWARAARANGLPFGASFHS
ncbi:MAG: alpha-L-fucosidase, partial [Rhodothermales bacterium]|nr:alpha-L-fucosidase [Rhodothermales bacterium]